MCGILFSWNNRVNFDTSLKIIKHRGPDDFGIENIGEVSLGSCRLSIQDLSPKGHMPMSDSSKRYWIVYNGEVYNFKEIKKDLGEFNFKSNSDTEVILYSYIKWGNKCLEKFRGMFSFVLYDSKENKIFAARDRFGQKPFLYFYNKKEFIVGSELKQILNLKPELKKFDESILSEYFVFRYTPNNKSGVQEVKSLAPASFLEGKLGDNLEEVKYWKYADIKIDNSLNECDVLNQYEELIVSSVDYRLISDVPVGVYLSGGLDSSLITAIASQKSKAPLNTFSVGYSKEDQETELNYAKFVADKYKTNHTEILVDINSINIESEIDKLFNYLDRPIGDPAIFPLFLMSQQMSGKTKVALNGDGGDELFSGYYKSLEIQKMNYFSYFPSVIKNPVSGVLKKVNSRAGFLAEGLSGNLEKAFLYRFGCFHPKIDTAYYVDLKSILKTEYYRSNAAEKYLNGLFSNFKNTYRKSEAFDVLSYMPDDTLPKVDFSTMASSIEARSPFLDHKLAEFAFSIPYNLRLKNGQTKYLTKKLAEKYLPNEIIYRKKQGFSVPFQKWFANDLYGYSNDILLNPNSFISNYTNRNIVKKLIEDNKKGIDYSNHLWLLVTLENWGTKYVS